MENSRRRGERGQTDTDMERGERESGQMMDRVEKKLLDSYGHITVCDNEMTI